MPKRGKGSRGGKGRIDAGFKLGVAGLVGGL